MKKLAVPLLLGLTVLMAGGCAAPAADDDRQARQYPPGKPLDSGRKSHRNQAVSSRLTVGKPIIEINGSKRSAQRTLAEPPKTKTLRKTPKFRKLENWPGRSAGQTRKGASSTVFDALDFEDNADNTGGFAFIPADPSLAAGPNHLLAVTNTSIAIYDKSGNELDSESLQDFFSPLSPPTFTFDPKVLFDQFENRFVLITLEREDVAEGASDNASRILVAVSDTDDPTGSWSVTDIDGLEVIAGQEHWVDFPGLAIDEEAVYITANMFQFFDQSDGGSFGGARVWIVDKGVNNGLYDGDDADVDRFNPFTSGTTAAGTHQPAHILGAPPPGNTGTWMVLASGLGSGNDLEAQVVRIDNPLANSPTFNFDFVSLGNIDQNRFDELGNLPQSGSTLDPDAGDRRTLDAVWRDNSLYFTSAVRARTGPDAGENTAIWAQINTQQSDDLVQLGFLGGEDIDGDTETAYGAVSVNADGVIALGFTSANDSTFLSSHYALHVPGDSSGSNRGSELIREGEDPFELTFGASEVRWGDYSSVALDPNGVCFWVYNKHAIDQGGSPIGGEDGRWGTAVAEVCLNQAPTPLADALTVAEGDDVNRTDEGDDSLLDNDSDPDGDSLDINRTPTTLPGVGTVSISGSGTFTYTHDGSDSSNDLFRYEVCDNGEPERCAEAQVNVVITEVNDPPIASDDSIANFTEDDEDTISIADLLSNDDVGDVGTGQSLDITEVDNEVGGTARVLSSSIRFTPDDDFFGQASFRYTAEDDGTTDGSDDPLTDTATVTFIITEINDDPIAIDDPIDDILEDTVYMIPTALLLANDSAGPANESNQALVIDSVNNDIGGNVSLDGDMVVFTPTSEFSGNARFDYRIEDNGTTNGAEDFLDDVGRATFRIIEVNDPPIAVTDNLPDVEEDSAEIRIPIDDLLSNDSEGASNEFTQQLTLTEVSNPIGGTVMLDGDDVVFTLTPQFSGPAGFNYTLVDDGETDGQPDPQSAIGMVTFSIVGDNDPPLALADTITVARGQQAVILSSGAVSLTDNDTDPENTALSVSPAPITEPANGTVSLASNGNFIYQHNGLDLTNDSFQYEVCDEGSPILCASAQVTVNVIEIPFARCTATGSRVVVGLLAGLSSADLFSSTQGDFTATGLPNSFSIDADSGVISGTPTSNDLSGSPYNIRITNNGVIRQLTLTVDASTDALFFSGIENDCL